MTSKCNNCNVDKSLGTCAYCDPDSDVLLDFQLMARIKEAKAVKERKRLNDNVKEQYCLGKEKGHEL